MDSVQRVTTSRLVRLLGQWTQRGGGLSRDLACAMRDLIQLEELPPGGVLPSERSLAEALSVSRTTVLAAYGALRDEELIDRHVGKGTWVAPRRTGDGQVAFNGPRGEDRIARYFSHPATVVDLTNAAVPGLPLVAEVAGALTARDFAPLVDTHGYNPLGLPDLRFRIAQWYSALGAPTTPDQILITSGAQQALELLTGALVKAGDLVLVDDPTFRAALQRLRACGARVEAIAMDEGGTDAQAVEKATKRLSPQLVYLLPSIHNPTGATTAADRTRRLATLAAKSQTLFVDDMSLATTCFDERGTVPMVAMEGSDWIITIGSFSKVFWGGLRLGWLRASARIIRELTDVKAVADLGSSQVSQLVTLSLFPHLDRAIRERRETLTVELDRLTGLLTESLPSWSWQKPSGGASLWVRLPFPCSVAFAEFARRQGVAVLPGPIFSPTESYDDHLRLPFAVKPNIMEAGIRRLALAWEDFSLLHRPSGAFPHAEPYV